MRQSFSLMARRRAAQLKRWRAMATDAAILRGIGIPKHAAVMRGGTGHGGGFLRNLAQLGTLEGLFPNRKNWAMYHATARIFQKQLQLAVYRPDYFLPREYTKGFSNVQSDYQCKCLLGVCNRRNESCLSDPQVEEAINGR